MITSTLPHPLTERPEVTTDPDGAIALRLSPAHADVLAKMLARFESLMTTTAPTLRRHLYEDPADPGAPALTGVEDWDPQVWMHVTVQLLAAKAGAGDPAVVQWWASNPVCLHVVDGGELR